MAKKGKKRIKSTDGTASMVGKQTQSGVPAQRVTFRRYAVWSIGSLIVVIGAISVWAFLGNSSRSSPKSASTDKSPAAASTKQSPTEASTEQLLVAKPAMKSGTDTIDVSGGPKISFPEKSYDFGTIAQGSKVSHTFVVRNAGDAPLRLIKAAGS